MVTRDIILSEIGTISIGLEYMSGVTPSSLCSGTSMQVIEEQEYHLSTSHHMSISQPDGRRGI